MKWLAGRAYQQLVRPLLFRMEPERAHEFVLALLRAAPSFPGGLACLRSFAPPPDSVSFLGLQFRNRIGLAAGFDKNGVAIPAWEALGFGFVEIGTVTAKAQPGNPPPRIFRYPEHQALINCLGFNNDGADVVAERLRQLRGSRRAPSIPIGVNLGKTRTTPLEQAADDYLYSFRRLHPVADYIALNVSSPNTPGLRKLQDQNGLTDLLGTITDENQGLPSPRPILIKIAPDLTDESLRQIVVAAEQFGLAGIIATNTTVDHSAIPRSERVGGLSGAPLRKRSTDIVRQLRTQTRLPIVGVGGIFDAESALEKITAGATLLQLYTGFIFRGPGLIREVSAAAAVKSARMT